ncbi:MAG: hypothetical protein HY361_01545 [Candidatus Aenigmarchaeota archaeon]|nr:hypothetical protein [Candidatus Aenigmarchaeota archaeon]
MGDDGQILNVTRGTSIRFNRVGSFAIPAVGSGTFNAGSWFPKTIKSIEFYTGDTISAGSFKIRAFRTFAAPTSVTTNFFGEIMYAVTPKMEFNESTYDANGSAKASDPNQVWFYAESGVSTTVNVYWVAKHD